VEACGFRDAFQKIQKAGATLGSGQMRKGEKWGSGPGPGNDRIVVLGISADTPEKQKKFKDKYDLPYTLLADVDKTVCKAYGVIKEKNMYGKKVMGIERTTFLIDGAGKIARIFPKVKAEGHAEEVLAALKQG
jgi:peroxiredoxin Q/BCP